MNTTISLNALRFILDNYNCEDLLVRLAFDIKLGFLQVDVLGNEILYEDDNLFFEREIKKTEFFYNINGVQFGVLKKCLKELKISFSVFYI